MMVLSNAFVLAKEFFYFGETLCATWLAIKYAVIQRRHLGKYTTPIPLRGVIIPNIPILNIVSIIMTTFII